MDGDGVAAIPLTNELAAAAAVWQICISLQKKPPSPAFSVLHYGYAPYAREFSKMLNVDTLA